MIKSDKELLWRPGRLFIPVQNMGFIYNATGAAGVKTAGAGTSSATNKVYTPVNSLQMVGVVLEAANDSIGGHTLLPYDYDRTKPMYVRAHWTSGSTDVTDTITWLVQYTAIVHNVTTIIDPATALDTVIAQDLVPVATAYTYCTTEFGKINGNKFADNVSSLTFEVIMSQFAAGLSEAKLLLGLELVYTPKRLRGIDGMLQEAKRPTHMLSNKYSD